MKEASKAALRRFKEDSVFWSNVFKGVGLDIGPGDDPCDANVKWPITLLEKFDQDRGDANFIRWHFDDESLDFIHSSHSLEHMSRHPWNCLIDWCSLLKVGGHLVFTVPDFEMYEHSHWPSRYNYDHKWAFTIKGKGNGSYMLATEDALAYLEKSGMELISIKRLTDGWIPNSQADQTFDFDKRVECAWEVVAVKKTSVFIKSPLHINRGFALGDTIAATAFLNHLSKKHDIIFSTYSGIVSFHNGLYKTVSDSIPIDVNLDNYDMENPQIPLWELGFHKTKIPIPIDAKPMIFLTDEEKAKVEILKEKRQIIIDTSDIWLKARKVSFDLPGLIEECIKMNFVPIVLTHMEPRDLLVHIASSVAVIGRDSAPTQLAQALGVPFIAMMSSVNPEKRYLPSLGITLVNECPINDKFCYHKRWSVTDCPIEGDIAPCGIYKLEDIINALKKITNQ
jgi:hypothetical protein